ncbi:MAG: alcohol dehydrogenase AdhP [bacterium]|nr:alcohol dehydrogenase AdhP [bacterium]
MCAKMRAAMVRAFGRPLALEQVPVPEPGPGEVLVRVAASGVCHTDLHAADGDWPVKPSLPFIPGHEGAGRVAAVGPGVTSRKEGDRVGVAWLHGACGACEYCLTGWETLCPRQRNSGYSANGSHAEYVAVPADFASPLPEGLPFVEAAPVLCAGVTTYKGLKETGARPGEWAAVVGVGGLGHLAVQYARAMGMRVAAVDIADDKLSLARGLGAELAVNAARENPVAEVVRETGGVHAALVTAVSPESFRQGVAMLRRGGTCVLVGLPPGDFPLPIFDVVLKRLTVRGSIVGTRQDLAEALRFAAAGKVRATIETHPLEAINEVFGRLRRGEVRGRAVLALE